MMRIIDFKKFEIDFRSNFNVKFEPNELLVVELTDVLFSQPSGVNQLALQKVHVKL